MDQFASLRRFQSEDEQDALAKALKQSVEMHNVRGGDRELAIPLCLPDNCKWDSRTGKTVKTRDKRSSLYVVDEALEQLREVKGPVCVVSVAGPYRKGKSYILSEAFDQPDVFPLGHEMLAETMGIWMWIVPEKYKGNEFTVILLDSEGIDSAATEGFHDHQIFTLTVLLASVLIYNSQDVPTRHDIEGLDFITQLSQRIQMRSNTGKGYGQRDMEFFHKTFPYFIWLLRDVSKTIPQDCKDIKDYFLKKVFKEQGTSNSDYKSKQVAESILRFFSGFDAFTLPCPTVDPETMKSINKKNGKVNPKFLSGLEMFKSLIKTILSPKHSFNDGEFVTGEGLAALVLLYVDAINSPDAIPNVQSAWDSFVDTKCSDTIQAALMTYDAILTSQLTDELPCDHDVIRNSHSAAFNICEDQLMAEMVGISTSKVERVVTELKESVVNRLNSWLTENEVQTRKSCKELLGQLKMTHLDPVLQKLQGKEAAEVSFDDVISGYTRIKNDYHNSAKGAKDVIAQVFFEFHPELVKEKEQYLGLLRQLKDFSEERSRVLAAQAYQEQERKRLEEQQSRLQEENRQQKKQMEMLLKNLDEERKRFSEQMESDRKAQQGQLENMMATSMKQAKAEREAFIKENQAFNDQYLAMQQVNENNMKIIEQMAQMTAQRQQEEKELREQMKAKADEENEALMRKLNEKHNEKMKSLSDEMNAMLDAMQQINENNMAAQRQQGEKELREQMKAKADEENEVLIRKLNEKHNQKMKALRDEMNAKLDDIMTQVPPSETLLCETPGLIQKRAKEADQLQGSIQKTLGEQEDVEKPGFWKRALQFVGKLVVPAVGAVVSAVVPAAGPLAAGACCVAEALSCSVM